LRNLFFHTRGGSIRDEVKMNPAMGGRILLVNGIPSPLVELTQEYRGFRTAMSPLIANGPTGTDRANPEPRSVGARDNEWNESF
jgi:hypothetical protein